MKINKQTSFDSINRMPSFQGGAASLGKKFAKSMSKFDQFGEGTTISFDFLGKAIITPLVIMFAANETKEKKTYSAVKNPHSSNYSTYS